MQPVDPVPMRPRPVGKDEIAEKAVEVVVVVIRDVPEHGLEVTRAGRLVDGIDDLLETVGDHLVQRAAAQRKVHDLIGPAEVVLAILAFEEIIHIEEELGRGAGPAQHGRDDEHHVDEPAAKGFEVGGSGGVSADITGTVEQPRVHRDRRAIVGKARLVVLIYIMVLQEIKVTLGGGFAIELPDTVAEQAAIQPDEALFGQLGDERGDVFVFDIGVGVIL